MSAYVDRDYMEALVSTSVLQNLLANQGVYAAPAGTATLDAVIGDASALMDSAILQAYGDASAPLTSVPDFVRAIVGAVVIRSLYARQGLDVPDWVKQKADLLERIRLGELKIPGLVGNAVAQIGGSTFTPFENTRDAVPALFSRNKMRW